MISPDPCDWSTPSLNLVVSAGAKPIIFGNQVGVSSRAIILKGVTIGDGAIVAAGPQFGWLPLRTPLAAVSRHPS